MTVDKVWTALLGLFVAIFGYMAYAVNPAYAVGDLALGLVVAQSVFTGFCPLRIVLKAAGLK